MLEKPYTPRDVLTPDLHPAYRAAHGIADAAYDAGIVSALAARARMIGFEPPSAEIYDIANRVGKLIGPL